MITTHDDNGALRRHVGPVLPTYLEQVPTEEGPVLVERSYRPVPWPTILANIGTVVSSVRADVDSGRIEDDPTAVAVAVAIAAQRFVRSDVDTVRSGHTAPWIRPDWNVDDDTAHGRPAGTYARVLSTAKPVRTNTGRTTVEVSRHGRAYVGGHTMAQPSPSLAMSPERLAHAIDTAPRTDGGHVDGLALERLTDVAYPDLPRLIGGDTVDWQEGGTWDEHRTGARSDRPGRVTLSWSTRYGMTPARPRASETVHDGELYGPATADGARVFIGHRCIDRGPTVEQIRAANRRTVDEAFTIPTADDLADVLVFADAVAVEDYRATITTADGANRGTVRIRRGKRSRFHLTWNGDKRDARTLSGLLRTLS